MRYCVIHTLDAEDRLEADVLLRDVSPVTVNTPQTSIAVTFPEYEILGDIDSMLGVFWGCPECHMRYPPALPPCFPKGR